MQSAVFFPHLFFFHAFQLNDGRYGMRGDFLDNFSPEPYFTGTYCIIANHTFPNGKNCKLEVLFLLLLLNLY